MDIAENQTLVKGNEEHITPGNEMALVMKLFVEEKSRKFKDVAISEKAPKNNHRITEFEIVCDKQVYEVKFIVHDNMALHFNKNKIFSKAIFDTALNKSLAKHMTRVVEEELVEFLEDKFINRYCVIYKRHEHLNDLCFIGKAYTLALEEIAYIFI